MGTNWTAIWKKAAKQLRFDISQLEPVKLELGCVESPARLAEIAPIFWIERKQSRAGLLEIHKQILQRRRLPPFELPLRVGMVDTLAYLDDVAGVAGREEDYIALLAEASLREITEGSAHLFIKELYVHLDSVRRALGNEGHCRWWWHHRSRSLAPNAFACWDDLVAELGPMPSQPRRISFDAFVRVIVRGHQRLFNDLALVRPTYFSEAPPSIRAELEAWRAECKAEQEARRIRWRAEEEARRREAERLAEEADRKRRMLLSPEDQGRAFDKRDWLKVTKEELQEALDQRPLTHLAVIYGVSEAAIRKRMKKWALTGKRQGYWLRRAQRSSGGGGGVNWPPAN